MLQIDQDHLSRRSGLLGTVIEVTISEAEDDEAGHAAVACFDEIDRLQRIFKVFDDDSEISRWRSRRTDPGPELSDVNTLARTWRSRTGGAFDPAVGALMSLWDACAASGAPPAPVEITRTLAAMSADPRPHWNLNAIAKGWIVDRAARHAYGTVAMWRLIVNPGGDLVSLGTSQIVVGIESPLRPFDNVPPIARVAMADAGLATSGPARRGWEIAATWHGHVLDPRTAYPGGRVTSASVLAHDAATADVVATSLNVLPIADGLALADHGLQFADSVDGTLRYRVHTIALRDGSMLVYAAPLRDTGTAPSSLTRALLRAGSGVLLLGSAATWWPVRRAIRPVGEKVETAEGIAAGDLTRRVPEGNPATDLGRLGVALNEMLAHIEGAVSAERASRDRLRQFVADASHELRTPITAISGYVERRRKGRPASVRSKRSTSPRSTSCRSRETWRPTMLRSTFSVRWSSTVPKPS